MDEIDNESHSHCEKKPFTRDSQKRYQHFFELLEFARYYAGTSYRSKDGSERKMSR